MSVIADVIQSTVAVIKGMKRTISEIPRPAKWTVQYPDVPVTVQPRYRGQHLLHVDEAGKEKCVACYLCAAACPSDCIYIEAEDDPRPYAERIGRDERYAKVYNIDYGRCIFCGFCVEACPKDAITHGYNFELSVYNRADLLKTKDDLLITKQVQSKNYRVAFSNEDVDSEFKKGEKHGAKIMKPFTKIAIVVFAVLCVLHILRLITGWEVEINRIAVPVWISGIGAVFAGVMAVMLWKESK